MRGGIWLAAALIFATVRASPDYDTWESSALAAATNPGVFSSFKRAGGTFYMLEHVNKNQADVFAEQLARRLDGIPSITLGGVVSFAARNDFLGNPYLDAVTVPGIPGPIIMSPSNMRYAWHGLEAATVAATAALEHGGTAVRVVEIGGGYGAVARMFLYYARELGLPVAEYLMVDLPGVSTLQNRFLEVSGTKDHAAAVGIEVVSMSRDELMERLESGCGGQRCHIDVVVSTYSFSEMDDKYRHDYARHIVGASKHGFVLWNRGASGQPGGNMTPEAAGGTSTRYYGKTAIAPQDFGFQAWPDQLDASLEVPDTSNQGMNVKVVW